MKILKICLVCNKSFLTTPSRGSKYCSRKCYYHGESTHNLSNSCFYSTWNNMKQRCNNKNKISYKDYGGRGITVCERWLKFENFKDDMYLNYKKHCKRYGKKNTLIERIDNNGNYKLDNCRWTTRKNQNNNKRNNHLLTYNNITLNISQWAKKLKINYDVLERRINKYNWDVKRAFLQPVRGKK